MFSYLLVVRATAVDGRGPEGTSQNDTTAKTSTEASGKR